MQLSIANVLTSLRIYITSFHTKINTIETSKNAIQSIKHIQQELNFTSSDDTIDTFWNPITRHVLKSSHGIMEIADQHNINVTLY